MKILFVHTVDPEAKLRNGATLRVANLCRALIGLGHEAILACNVQDDGRILTYLSELKDEGYISEFAILNYEPRPRRRSIGYQLFFGAPRLVSRLLQEEQESVKSWLEGFIARERVDKVVLVDRLLLFLSDVSPEKTYVDFIDSFTLYRRRSIQGAIANRNFFGAARQAREMLFARLEERFYARRCKAWFAASGVDEAAITSASGTETGRTIPNGVTPRECAYATEKVKGRIIFSGNMGFPPNIEAALWFIDNVFPIVLEERPDSRLIIAGSNPAPSLLQRESSHIAIPGFVEDLDREIRESELYVAPLVSGGGFKNKVVEALLAGTYVASTTMGVEFLDADFHRDLLVADDPNDFAQKILRFLQEPSRYDAALKRLQNKINNELTWRAAASRMIAILSGESRSKHFAVSPSDASRI